MTESSPSPGAWATLAGSERSSRRRESCVTHPGGIYMTTTPPPIQVVTTDPDERNLAALAHATILLNFIFPGMGLVAAAVIWLTQRERSSYVGNQALQATVFQVVLVFVATASGILGVVLVLV